MSDLVQREELGAFLRSRREATDPVSEGFQPGTRRRTPGLRREELAQLAGLSVTWYTWIEQGRDISVSRQVIESLATALRLTQPERAHLFTLAGLALPPSGPHPRKIDPLLERLVQELHPRPAYVMTPWWDLLAYNDGYAELLGGLDQRPEGERNILWLIFIESRGSELFVDWMGEARSLVGQFRATLAQYPDDPRGPELLKTMQEASDMFCELWDEGGISRFTSSRKKIRHPRLGRIDHDYVKLADAHDEQQSLIVFLEVERTDED
ncbi:helix-turn-helix transcriptional regulator [Streptomyces sp. NBC_00576]|uniref:helix-turn-helix transcriptional regulator n=1 Tax=Streptomyces sp. NBC_00576 TaxID=2903665 RepID=UPI002E80C282|nr:helix-turn-helix transcriptional regulator [Streptomyces sp. NBC_00576]WUB75515.1 helix-turn-helix transcriptional regulator [Streptomyces sp. NBC_00576]